VQAAGWEKGQVENQVGVVRERFFTPRLRFASFEELNAWLLDRCREHARTHRHPELRERTVAEVFEDEKPALLRLPTARTRRLPCTPSDRLEDAARPV
jgi:hypothetical protein